MSWWSDFWGTTPEAAPTPPEPPRGLEFRTEHPKIIVGVDSAGLVTITFSQPSGYGASSTYAFGKEPAMFLRRALDTVMKELAAPADSTPLASEEPKP